MDNSKTVRLTSCSSSIQAHMLQGALEAEGIRSVAHNENMSDLFSGLVSIFTGVDIFVYEDDLERAKTILAEFSKNNETTD